MQQLYANYSLLMIMLGAGIITLLLQSIAGHVMNDLLEECSKIAGTKNPWIRNLIKKFQVCYELHIPAKDVGGFVDRYLLEYRAYQIRLSTWENVGLYGECILGCVRFMGYIFRHHFKFMVCIVSTPLSY